MLVPYRRVHVDGCEAVKKKVIGIGSAHIDLFLKVDKETFDSFSSLKSRYLSTEEFDRLSRQKGIMALPGGCAANTIRGLAHLGLPTAFLSCVGNDLEGDLFLSNLRKLGIRSEVTARADFSTIRLLCLIGVDGEKRILYPDQAEPRTTFNKNQFLDVDWVHIDAFQFEIGNALEKAMEFARCSTSFNLGNSQVAAEYKEKILAFLEQHAEIVFGNEEEIASVTGLGGEAGCKKLQAICPIVAMTRGSKGCLIASENGIFTVPAFPAKRIDSTGAGDYFASGFLFGYMHGFPLIRCAEIGNRLGSALIEVLGTELPEEKWKMLKKSV